MKFKPPVIAGIVSGCIVLATGIVVLFLYLAGFFTSRMDSILKSELPNAVQATKGDFDSQLIVDALKAGTFEKEESKSAITEWMENKLPEIEDAPALTRLLKVFTLFTELVNEKLLNCGEDDECIKNLSDDSVISLHVLESLCDMIHKQCDLEIDIDSLPSEEVVKSGVKDKKKKKILQIFLPFCKTLFENILKNSKTTEAEAKEVKEAIRKIDVLLKLL